MIEKPIKITDELLKEHFSIPAKGGTGKVELEQLFKAVMAEIKETAQSALSYDQICSAPQAVRRLAQKFKATQVALQGMLDWYEDTHGVGFCECDKSVDLTCRACVARAVLPVAGKCWHIASVKGNRCFVCGELVAATTPA